MFKLRVLKAITILILITFSLQNIASANPDIFAQSTVRETDTLGIWWRIQEKGREYGVDYKSVSLLIDVTEELFREDGVHPENLIRHIKKRPSLTQTMQDSLDFDNLHIVDDTLWSIGYHGANKECDIFLATKPGRIPDVDEEFQIRGIFVSFKDRGTESADDVAGAAEGTGTVHEAEKKYVSRLGGLLKGWKRKGQKGINDIIRKYWRKGVPVKGCKEMPDRAKVLNVLYYLPGFQYIADSIAVDKDKKYKFYVYPTRKRDFVDGITTHYGIRTGSVHITKKEYERLKKLGDVHLAARMAHEVEEINRWREKADELESDRVIGGLGEAKGDYDENWSNGIRKWIRDNCNRSLTGKAQKLDREIHRAGLETEISVLVEYLLARQKTKKDYRAVREVALKFLEGKRSFINVYNETATVTSKEKVSEVEATIGEYCEHFTRDEEKEFFINVLYARTCIALARMPEGGMDTLHDAKTKKKRLEKINEWIVVLEGDMGHMELADKRTIDLVEQWIKEMRAIQSFTAKANAGKAQKKLMKLLNDKNEEGFPDRGFLKNPEDIIGSSDTAEDPEFEREIGVIDKGYLDQLEAKLMQLTVQGDHLKQQIQGITVVRLTDAEKGQLAQTRAEIEQVNSRLAEIDNLKKQKIRHRSQEKQLDKELQAIEGDEEVVGLASDGDRRELAERRKTFEKDLASWKTRNQKIKMAFMEEGGLTERRDVLRNNLKVLQEKEEKAQIAQNTIDELDLHMRELERQKITLIGKLEKVKRGSVEEETIEEEQVVAHPLAPGTFVNQRYEIVEQKGKGGFGVTYTVRDTEQKTHRHPDGKIMILKMLLPGKKTSEFDREKQTLIDLDGAQAPDFRDDGTYKGSPYYVMSYIEGVTLKDINEGLKNGSMYMTIDEKLLLLNAVVTALITWQRDGTIHRDVKPDNIMIAVKEDGSVAFPDVENGEKLFGGTFERKVTLVDPGSAVRGEVDEDGVLKEDAGRTDLTGEGIIRGTPKYLSPEQVLAQPITQFTDVYSLGVVAYEFLSHHLPVGEDAETTQAWFMSHINQEPDPLNKKILEENERLKGEKDQGFVNEDRLNAIREGLVNWLSLPETRLMYRDDQGNLRWREKVIADEESFEEHLRKIPWLASDENTRKKIIASVLIKLPQVDSYVEALIHHMMQKTPATERPTPEVIGEQIHLYLTGRKDEMDECYRPSVEGEVKGWLVRGAEWVQKRAARFATLAVAVAAIFAVVSSTVGYLYYKAIGKIKRAEEAEQNAHAAMKKLRTEKKKVEDHVAKLQEETRKLNEERGNVVASLDKLKKETGTVEQKKATLAEQVEAFTKQSQQNRQNLEQAVKTLEEQEKTLEARIREAEGELAKTRTARQKEETSRKAAEAARAKAQKALAEARAAKEEAQEELKKARAEIAKFRKSIPGVFEDAKTEAKNLEASNAVGVVRSRIPYWTIDKASFKKFLFGFDEISKIMVDNGQFDEAIKLEVERIAQIRQVSDWSASSPVEKLPFEEAVVRSQITQVKIKQAKGDYSAAGKDARSLMKKDAYKASKERMELLRNSLIEVLLEDAATSGDEKIINARLLEAEQLIKQVGPEEKNLYYGNLYLVKKNFRKALRYFGLYNSHWAEQALEKGIASGQKSQRSARAAHGLLLSAFTHVVQAMIYRDKGDKDDMADSLKSAMGILQKIKEKYPNQKATAALALLVKGEILTLEGKEEEAKKAFAGAELAAETNRQKLVLILVRAALKKEAGFDDLMDTWSVVVFGRTLIPILHLEGLKTTLWMATGRHQRQIKDLRKRAEEAKLRKEELQRLKNALRRDVKTSADARTKLAKISREIKTLKSSLRREKDLQEKKRIEAQLKRALEKEAYLKFLEKKFENEEKDRPEGASILEGEGREIHIPARFLVKRPEFPVELPIANRVSKAPDHRLLNAVIECALDEGLWEIPEKGPVKATMDKHKDIIVMLPRTDRQHFGETYRNFGDIYRSLVNQKKVWELFRTFCDRDGVKDEGLIGSTFQKELPKLKYIKGHAGVAGLPNVNKSRIFIADVSGFYKIRLLHEVEELRIHQKEAAQRAEYASWDGKNGVPEQERRDAVTNLRSSEDYNEFVVRAHEEANKKFRVDGEELVEDVAQETNAFDEFYEVPIAAASSELSEKSDKAVTYADVLDAVESIATILRGRFVAKVGEVSKQAADIGKHGKTDKGVILFADDVVEGSAVFDIKKLAKMMQEKDSILDKVVLFEGDKGDSRKNVLFLERIIKDVYSQANVVIISRLQVDAAAGGEADNLPLINKIKRYCTNHRILTPRQMLGIVRGPLSKLETKERVKRDVMSNGVHVVVFKSQGKIYSVMDALAKLISAKRQSNSKGFFIELDSITPYVSEVIQVEYERYKYLLKNLAAAA